MTRPEEKNEEPRTPIELHRSKPDETGGHLFKLFFKRMNDAK